MDLNKSFGGDDTKAKEWMAKHPILMGIIFIFIIIFLMNIFSGSDEPQSVTENTQPVVQIPKEQAQKELNEMMALSKKAGLVTSYEFSDKATDVYVGSVWYTQTVQQKKDFIAYIGLRKKAITGYSHFEVRDAHSNEKVGEITSFSQSIEVYK